FHASRRARRRRVAVGPGHRARPRQPRLQPRREQAQLPRRQRGHHGGRRPDLLWRREDGGDEGLGGLRMTQSGARSYELQALTDIWTGDVNGKASSLIPTGLLGSIRWWFEVLVRGLGGAPCDPSSKQKTCSAEHHCVVCELFGCTGWARKFHFDVRDQEGEIIA